MLSCLPWLKCWVKLTGKKQRSFNRVLLWKQESSIISWWWSSGFIFQLSTASKMVCIWSQKPQTDLQLFAFQGRQGQRVSSTSWCLWSYFDRCRNNRNKSCTPTSHIIITNKLMLLLQGNYQLWKNARCWRLIETHPRPEQYYINFKMFSFPTYNKNSLV